VETRIAGGLNGQCSQKSFLQPVDVLQQLGHHLVSLQNLLHCGHQPSAGVFESVADLQSFAASLARRLNQVPGQFRAALSSTSRMTFA